MWGRDVGSSGIRRVHVGLTQAYQGFVRVRPSENFDGPKSTDAGGSFVKPVDNSKSARGIVL